MTKLTHWDPFGRWFAMPKWMDEFEESSQQRGLKIQETEKNIVAEAVVAGVPAKDIEVHIEDVCANNAVFMKPANSKKSIAEAKARGRTLGMCQQSQIELERLIEYWDIKIVKHKTSKMWKKDKKQFEMVTGWVGRSNEDNRSAAYFAFLGG